MGLDSSSKILALDELATEISHCRRCDAQGLEVLHAPPLKRGLPGKIMVVGIEPGNTELSSGIAFSGPAGKRLAEWMIQAGLANSTGELFQKTYFTSVCKCKTRSQSDVKRCASNCIDFLLRQIELVNPEICITLGLLPLQAMFGYRGSLNEAVGKSWTEYELGALIPMLGASALVVPLPHPSGLSRWHNDSQNKKLLSSAISALSRAYQQC